MSLKVLNGLILTFTRCFMRPNSALFAGIGNNLTQRLLYGTLHNSDTGLLIFIDCCKTFKAVDSTDICDTATGNNTLFNGRACSAKCIIDTVFLLFHFNL